MTAPRLLVGLDPAQRLAVTTPERPLRVLAPAGSGKTRVLTRMIAHGVHAETLDPDRILAVTFTRKAAGELRQRLTALGLPPTIAAGTFHAAAWAQLRQWWNDQGVTAPALVRSRPAMLRRVARAEGLTVGDAGPEIDWACARTISPDRYPGEAARAGRRPSVAPERVVALYRAYEAAKRARHVVDFDDILRMVTHTLETRPDRARALRWRYHHFFVDEFQDVNPLQFRLLEAWLGGRSDLCVVGDPHQAIYGWNGADAGFLRDFEAIFPDATTIALDRNYRSTAGVLAVGNAVLPASSPPEAALDIGPPPEIRRFETSADEATHIAEAIRSHRAAGRSWRRHGVLVRTHGQATTIAEALTAAGIPFRIRGAAGSATRNELDRALDGLRPAASIEVALVDWTLDAAEGRGGPAEETLLRLGREFAAMQPGASIADFVVWVRDMVSDDGTGPGSSDRVDVATLHAAKGLEWDTVFLAGLEEGFLPISHAETGAALAEEQRLLYVGITRARTHLICTWAQRRQFGSRSSRREPSRWLHAMQQAVDELRLEDQPAPMPPTIIDLRPRPEPPEHAARRDRLVAWRQATARRSAASPAAILSDDLLDRVVAEAPEDLDALGALGVGPSHVRHYGAAICSILHDSSETATANR